MRKFPVFVGASKRMALIMLRVALAHVKRYRRCAICGAIRAHENTALAAIVGPDITDWVMDSLGAHAYLEDWLEAQAVKGRAGFAGALELGAAIYKDWDGRFADPKDEALIQKLKTTRIAWLEWMIEQVEQS